MDNGQAITESEVQEVRLRLSEEEKERKTLERQVEQLSEKTADFEG